MLSCTRYPTRADGPCSRPFARVPPRRVSWPRLLPIARTGVSRHLRVLREAGLVEVREEAQFRVYSLHPEPLAQIDDWLDRYRSLWEQRLDALHTEVARGKKKRGTKS